MLQPTSPSDTGVVGYIGLGNMGWPLAERVGKRFPLRVCDRNADIAARMVQLSGAQNCGTPAQLAAGCETILLCLPTSQHVREVIFGPGGLASSAAAGTLVIDQTTGDPIETRAMATELSGTGIELIDAPVSGGPEGAVAGTIAIMVGGTAGQYTRAIPVLQAISPNIFHAGALGCGYVAKLANNLLFAATRLMTLEAVALASKNGIEPHRIVEIMQAGSSRNFFLEHSMIPHILSGKLASGFTLGLLHKDVTLATKLGMSSDTTLLLGNLVREIYQMGINEMGRDTQVNTIAVLMDRLSGSHVVPSDQSLK